MIANLSLVISSCALSSDRLARSSTPSWRWPPRGRRGSGSSRCCWETASSFGELTPSAGTSRPPSQCPKAPMAKWALAGRGWRDYGAGFSWWWGAGDHVFIWHSKSRIFWEILIGHQIRHAALQERASPLAGHLRRRTGVRCVSMTKKVCPCDWARMILILDDRYRRIGYHPVISQGFLHVCGLLTFL